MRLAVLITNWTIGVALTIIGITFIVQANNGTTGNGSAILMCLIWIAQCVLTIVYAYRSKIWPNKTV